MKLIIELSEEMAESYLTNMNAEAAEFADEDHDGMSLTVDGERMSVGVTKISGIVIGDEMPIPSISL